MGLLNKSENWWLRLTIVIITMISLSTLSYYNRQVTQLTTKSTLDSTAYYKAQYDTLSNQYDSVRDEIEVTKNFNARIELGVEAYGDESSHQQMKQDRDFVSKFTKQQRLKAINRINVLRIGYDYPACSWVIAFEIFKKDEPAIGAEIEKFIDHLTE